MACCDTYTVTATASDSAESVHASTRDRLSSAWCACRSTHPSRVTRSPPSAPPPSLPPSPATTTTSLTTPRRAWSGAAHGGSGATSAMLSGSSAIDPAACTTPATTLAWQYGPMHSGAHCDSDCTCSVSRSGGGGECASHGGAGSPRIAAPLPRTARQSSSSAGGGCGSAPASRSSGRHAPGSGPTATHERDGGWSPKYSQ